MDSRDNATSAKSAVAANGSSQSLAGEAKKAAEVMRSGGVILYPTETVWGIGCDASRSEAVKRVYEIKKRVDSKALITLVDSTDMLERYVYEVPEVAYQLIEAAVSPLTIVYDKGVGVAPELLAPDGSIGIRVTTDEFCRRMIRSLRRPIVSTSANISGTPSPSTFRAISKEIIDAVDYVAPIRHDTASSAKPSTVIKLACDGQFKILRK